MDQKLFACFKNQKSLEPEKIIKSATTQEVLINYC